MSRWLSLFTLILAGEIVFGLPFLTARFFRPTMLEVFQLSNTQLGDLFAAYGITAMLSYFPGGLLADRFATRTLLTASLLATACGGFLMMQFPDPVTMAALYAFWGITSILLFWGALIKATREWGGVASQGKAFGFLDAGRGLVAALVSYLALRVFTASLPEGDLTVLGREAAFANVILTYTLFTLAAAAMVWLFIPRKVSDHRTSSLEGARTVLGRPVLWAQAGVVVAAYCGYKGTDNFALYANQVLGFSELESAQLAVWGGYIRPVGALLAGIVADRISASRSVLLAFVAMFATYLALALTNTPEAHLVFVLSNLFVSYFAVVGLRGIYFALLEENKTPAHVTGAATGLVSVIGYTPDVFFASVGGRILDANPGLVGHQNYFLFLACIAGFGLLATAALILLNRYRNPWTAALRAPD
jgi:sugar phosphate permease